LDEAELDRAKTAVALIATNLTARLAARHGIGACGPDKRSRIEVSAHERDEIGDCDAFASIDYAGLDVSDEPLTHVRFGDAAIGVVMPKFLVKLRGIEASGNERRWSADVLVRTTGASDHFRHWEEAHAFDDGITIDGDLGALLTWFEKHRGALRRQLDKNLLAIHEEHKEEKKRAFIEGLKTFSVFAVVFLAIALLISLKK